MSKRTTIMLATALPLVAFLALLGWAAARSEGVPGGLLVNTNVGEVGIQHGSALTFTSKTLDGEAITLSDLKGQVVMVNFWASWCPPCRREALALAQVYREYQAEPLEFVGIDIWDREEDARNYIDLFSVPYPNILDKGGKIAIDYGVTGIPESYFVDASGNLKRKFVGPLNEERLRTILNEMLPP